LEDSEAGISGTVPPGLRGEKLRWLHARLQGQEDTHTYTPASVSDVASSLQRLVGLAGALARVPSSLALEARGLVMERFLDQKSVDRPLAAEVAAALGFDSLVTSRPGTIPVQEALALRMRLLSDKSSQLITEFRERQAGPDPQVVRQAAALATGLDGLQQTLEGGDAALKAAVLAQLPEAERSSPLARWLLGQ
jgi:hypothetical protein